MVKSSSTNLTHLPSRMILEFLASLPQTTVLALIGTSAAVYIISKRVKASTSLPLPPGPPADSLWGNSFEAAL